MRHTGQKEPLSFAEALWWQRNVHFSVAARDGDIDRFDDAPHMRFKSGPLGMPYHHNCDHALFQVVPTAKVLVRRQKQLISSLLREGQEIAVSKAFPDRRECALRRVSGGLSRLRAANSITS